MSTFLQALLLNLLRMKTDPPDRARLHALSPAQWDALIRLAMQQHVTPMLFARLRDKGSETAVPDSIRQQLHHEYRLNSVRNKSIYHAFEKLATALHQSNIPMIPLKGAFLAAQVYPTVGERVIGDLDLLVPKAHLAKVIEIGTANEFHPPSPIILDTWVENIRHAPKCYNSYYQLAVEWHWHIETPNTPFSFPVSDLWRRAKPVTLFNTPMFMLSAEDLLLHVAFHCAYQHHFSFGLRGLMDIGMICDVYSEVINWQTVVQRAVGWHWQHGIYLSCQLAKHYLGANVPEWALAELRPVEFTPSILQLALEQMFIDADSFMHVPRTARLFFATPGIFSKLQVMKSTLFPDDEWMALRYGIAPGSQTWLKKVLFRWQQLFLLTLKKGRRLKNSKTAVLPVAKRKHQLATWVSQSASSPSGKKMEKRTRTR